MKKTCTADSNWYSKDEYLKGTGTEMGLGFTGIPFLNVNLIYRMNSLTKTNIDYSAVGGIPSTKPKELVLAVSLPVDI